MTDRNLKLSQEEVLLAFSSEAKHDRGTLAHYLSEYPEHAEALVEWSIELFVSASRNDEVKMTSETAVDRAWQRFQTAILVPLDTSIKSPFATLGRAAFKGLSKRLDVNDLLLARLRDRAINVNTIPGRFVQKIATALGATEDELKGYLTGPPIVAQSVSFRSAEKPAAGAQISFEEAIETSHLTQVQKDALKALRD
jgi:hypothetical protein